MAVSRVFTAGGREFDNEADAKRHDAILAAGQKMESAMKTLSRLLGESAKTKDGCAFEWSLLKDYYLVHEGWGQEPRLETLSIYVHYATVEEDRVKPGLVIAIYEPDNRTFRGTYRMVRVDELYAKKKVADAALIAAYERYIADVSERFTKLKEATHAH